uniref:RING-type domain-containing protein n=1 Tax=Salarias fasciatus TaxID=181472 RepID=A0A672GY24_SALFA
PTGFHPFTVCIVDLHADEPSTKQVHCSICLDVFTNPVSIPCGHNFCQNCILGYWKTSPLYQCPMCKKSFYKRPDISVNTVLREIGPAAPLKKSNSSRRKSPSCRGDTQSWSSSPRRKTTSPSSRY